MDIIAPTRLPNGARVWLDGETRDFIRRLNELDPRLALVQHTDGSWSIWRVGEDGSEWLIARSKPYARLDPGVIEILRQNDLRRDSGEKIADRMIDHNERLIRENKERGADALAEAVDKALSKSWHGRLPTKGEGIE